MGRKAQEAVTMWTRIVGTLIVGLWLAGCATSGKIITPDGKQGYSINCSGIFLTWGNCYKKAGKRCGLKGYEILDRTGESHATISGNQFGLYGGSMVNRNMIIECKE